MNRLEDSFMLWKSIVANRLLARVNIVLFLNKCDLLQRKLAAGARIGSYMISYGDRPNDYESVSKCACAALCVWVRGAGAERSVQISGTSSARCTRRIRRTRSAICSVRFARHLPAGTRADPPVLQSTSRP